MKAVVIGLAVLLAIGGGMNIHLWQKVRQQRGLAAADVQERVALARLQRAALESLLEDNRPQAITNLAYLLYMDTCLADVAAVSLLTEAQKKELAEEARLARRLFDHPDLTSCAALMNGSDPLRRTLWPRSTADDRKQEGAQQGAAPPPSAPTGPSEGAR